MIMEAIDSVGAASPIGGTVMVVDDDPASLRLMEEILRLPRYKVQSFQEGRIALTAASKSPPDLVILDIKMPGISGYEVCNRFKSSPKLSKIPVIFLSALTAPADRLRGFRFGAVDYISKPLQFKDARARVDAHLRLRHVQRKSETDNCLLRKRIHLQLREIADAKVETVFAIAKMAEARDGQTGRHMERVQTFCRLLAVGLSKVEKYKPSIDRSWIRNVYQASPLHDIGKIAISDRILLKPGALTPEEFAIMRTHAAIGAQTLQLLHRRYPGNEYLEVGIEIARSHHEWWDGSGYPDSLAGEEIPLCARILALADCYDAIRSKRCYKPAISHDETCSIIIGDSGKHFDPAVVAVFSELADRFRKVWKQMNTIPSPGTQMAGPSFAPLQNRPF
jgi:putative two-component system response regulator